MTYTDPSGIDAATIPNGSIQVTGPNGYLDFPTLVSLDVPGNGSPRVATYRSTPPGGYWDNPDAGTYTVSLTNRHGEGPRRQHPAGHRARYVQRLGRGPGRADLLPASDSGASSADDITNFNNASPATALQFVIANTTPGAFVSLYTDGGIFVGTAMADGTSATITTNPGPAFTDGVHDFWAREQPQGGGPSPDGPSLPVVIDTVAAAPGARRSRRAATAASRGTG